MRGNKSCHYCGRSVGGRSLKYFDEAIGVVETCYQCKAHKMKIARRHRAGLRAKSRIQNSNTAIL